MQQSRAEKPWPRRLPAASEIRQLTGLRGVLALDVVLGHYEINFNPAVHLFVFHDAAVDFFFCLSSFVLCLAYGAGSGRRLDVRAYAVARFARIYPLYLFSTLLMLAMLVGWHTGAVVDLKTARILRQLLHQLLLLGALPIPAFTGFWNVPAWSVSIEAFCYIAVFPILYLLCGPALRLPARLVGVVAVLAGFVSLAMFTWHYNPLILAIGHAPMTDPYSNWVLVARGAAMFVAGWLVYLLYLRSDPIREAAGLLTDAMAVVLALSVAGADYGLTSRQTVVVLAPFLILGLMDGRSVTARLLASRPIHALGLVSYSLYLLHLPVLVAVMHWVPGLLQDRIMLRIGGPMLASVAAAIMSYILIEAPARRSLRRLLGDRALSPRPREQDGPGFLVAARSPPPSPT
jgi:peptidoglycan/LPS O-acetylase OafA/YrhL